AGAVVGELLCPGQRIQTSGLAPAVGEYLPVWSGFAGRRLFGVNGADNALVAIAGGGFTNQLGIGDRRRINGHLVRAPGQQPLNVRQAAQAATYGERDEDFVGHALHQVEQRVAALVTGRDIEQDQFVGAGLVVAARQFDRIDGLLQIDKARALDHLAILDIQAGNDAFRQRHAFSAPAISCCAAAKSSVPSYSARPMMAPLTPSLSASSRARMSLRSVTPPEAMTGIDNSLASARVASMLRPCIMPSRRMSVCTMATTPSCSNCCASSAAVLRDSFDQPSVATLSSRVSRPTMMRPGKPMPTSETKCGSDTARVPRMMNSTPRSR